MKAYDYVGYYSNRIMYRTGLHRADDKVYVHCPLCPV
jgi:hypothetical protein